MMDGVVAQKDSLSCRTGRMHTVSFTYHNSESNLVPSCINDRVRVGTVKWAPTYGDKTDAEIVSPLLLSPTPFSNS